MKKKEELKSIVLALLIMITCILLGYFASRVELKHERARARNYEQLFYDAIQIYGYECNDRPCDSSVNIDSLYNL